MKTRTQTILIIMNVIFWVTFVGLCIKTGALLISFCVSLFVNTAGSKDLYLGLDLSELYGHSPAQYVSIVSLMVAMNALKTYITYLVIKIFSKINLANPFSTKVAALITKISHVALGTGILALVAQGYSKWLLNHGHTVGEDWGASEFLFLAGIIFIIAQVFNKGIELRSENELTI